MRAVIGWREIFDASWGGGGGVWDVARCRMGVDRARVIDA